MVKWICGCGAQTKFSVGTIDIADINSESKGGVGKIGLQNAGKCRVETHELTLLSLAGLGDSGIERAWHKYFLSSKYIDWLRFSWIGLECNENYVVRTTKLSTLGHTLP